VCSFVAGVCDLYATLQSVLSDLNNDTLKLPENVKKETITDAWRDVFAAECDGRLVRLWMNLSGASPNTAECFRRVNKTESDQMVADEYKHLCLYSFAGSD